MEISPVTPPLNRLPIQPATPHFTVDGVACVQLWQSTVSRSGNTYMKAHVGHRDGHVVLRLFEKDLPAWEGIGAGDAVHVCLVGRAGSNGFGPSWECTSVQRLADDHAIRQDLLPSCPIPFEELNARWEALYARLSFPAQALLTVVLWYVGEEVYRAAPAAKGQHHAVAPHGLWWHSIEVTEYALALYECQTRYQGILSTDLLILGGLLHDIGKTLEYRAEPGVGISMAPIASARYHTTLGIQLVTAAVERFHTALQHRQTPPALVEGLLAIIESHHALKEWGSPSAPSSLEGMLIHVADKASADSARFYALLETATPCAEPGWYRTANGRPDYVQSFHSIAPSPTRVDAPASAVTHALAPQRELAADTDWVTVTLDQEDA
jgi:putative nucleotidyltransferase with HDIG domain